MALIKEKVVKGLVADYWKIVDCNVKTGDVMLALYANKESAKQRGNMLEGRVKFGISFPVDVTNPISYAYTKIKESKLETIVIEEAIEEQLDEVGNIIVEAKEAVTEEVETNWFVDAVDEI